MLSTTIQVCFTDFFFSRNKKIRVCISCFFFLDGLFEIDKRTGEIKITSPITDFNIMEFNLIVKASQTDNQLRTAMSMVSIVVVDVNEHAPKFDADIYETSVQENAQLDTIVCEVHATDLDSNRIEYSILNNHESPFVIDKYRGVLKVNGRIDYEMKTKYEIEVQAYDGKHSEKVRVLVNILNIVDKAPYFEYNHYNFKIKVPYDVYVGQIKATDIEGTGNMTYRMQFNDMNDSSLFCITQTGTMYICSSIVTPKLSELAENIDYLMSQFTKDEYQFNVSVSVYSPDLQTELENHVECHIQIESKQITAENTLNLKLNESTSNRIKGVTKLMQSPYQQTRPGGMPVLFMNEQMFKDATTVYILIGIITGTLVILLFCASVFMWFKCKKFSKKKKCHRHHQQHGTTSHHTISGASSHNESKYSKNSLKVTLNSNKIPFDLLDKQTTPENNKKLANSSGICSGSSNLSEGAIEHHHINITSSKDSTSSGVSCVSSCSNCSKISKRDSVGLENHMFYSEWQNKMSDEHGDMIHLDQSSNVNIAKNAEPINDSSPISKITMLSEYVMESNMQVHHLHNHHHQQQQQHHKNSNILKLNILKSGIESESNIRSTYPYSDLLSTTTGNPKNSEKPVLLQPAEYMYDLDEGLNNSHLNHGDYAYSGHLNKGYTTTFKKPVRKLAPNDSHSYMNSKTTSSLLTTMSLTDNTSQNPELMENDENRMNSSPKLLSFLPPSSNYYECNSDYSVVNKQNLFGKYYFNFF
jgi:hypothetical protein